MINLDFSSFENIFCDSEEALLFAKKNGLKKNARVVTSSPKLLIKNKKYYVYDKNWTVDKLNKFSEQINPVSKAVFYKLSKNKKIKIDVALLVALHTMNFHKILYKIASLQEKDLERKNLFFKVSGKFGIKSLDMNSPLEKILINKKSCQKVFKIKNKEKNKSDIFDKIKYFIYRIQVAGLKGIAFTLIKKLYFLPPKNSLVYILGYNELISETALSLLLKGYKVKDLNIDRPEQILNLKKKFNLIKKDILPIIKNRFSQTLQSKLVTKTEELFFNELYKNLCLFQNYKEESLKHLSKISKKKIILLTPNHLSPKTLGILSAFKEKNFPIISFQHGVTPEISEISERIACSHPANFVDCFIAFNKISGNIAQKQAYIKSNYFIAGLPKRYYAAANKYNLFLEKKVDYLFLSMNLYRGVISSFNSNYTDIQKAKKEINIIKKVLNKIPHKIDYKPYITENPRYTDEDPVIEIINRFKNINLVDGKIDARFLISKYKIFIIQGASSTLSWIILTDKPIIFIDDKNQSTLSASIVPEFKKSLFYFNLNSRNFYKKINTLLSKPIKEIDCLYKKKKENRKRLVKKYFSNKRKYAGKTSANFIIDKYIN